MTASPLPFALRLNALASCITGLACLSLAGPLAEVLGIAAPRNLHGLGSLLLAHCVVLMWATGRARIAEWTKWNIALLLPYILLLVALIVTGVIPTATGRAILTLDAALVAGLAWLQWRALMAEARPA